MGKRIIWEVNFSAIIYLAILIIIDLFWRFVNINPGHLVDHRSTFIIVILWPLCFKCWWNHFNRAHCSLSNTYQAFRTSKYLKNDDSKSRSTLNSILWSTNQMSPGSMLTNLPKRSIIITTLYRPWNSTETYCRYFLKYLLKDRNQNRS